MPAGKMSFEIPAGLTELLQDFTVAVLRGRPSDLYQFAAEYFAEANERRSGGSEQQTNFNKKGVSFEGLSTAASQQVDNDHQGDGLANRNNQSDEESDEEFIG